MILKVNLKELQINSQRILTNLNFSVNKWEIFNILWYNWSWKTSLLKSIIWLYEFDWKLFLNDEDISKLDISTKANRWISFIMQEIPEYTWIKVEVYIRQILKENYDIDKIEKLFLDFWLDFQIYKDRFFDSHLSGGERKKIEIITNFLMNKSLYLLDEIEASLDSTSRQVLIDLIKSENKKWKTFIIVSHNKDILELADKWILLCNNTIEKRWENKKLLDFYFWHCKNCNLSWKCNI